MRANHVLTAALLIVLLGLPAATAEPANALPATPPASVRPHTGTPAARTLLRSSLPAAWPAGHRAGGRGDSVEANPAPGPTTLPADLPDDWWTTVQEDIRQSEYDITWHTLTGLPGLTASYQAPNRAQGLRTYFTPTGIRLTPRTEEEPSWELGLALVGYGEARELVVEGPRVDYHRGPAEPRASEWYVNDGQGLETGFSLLAPTSSDWMLQLALSGSLEPRVTADGTTLELLDAAGTVALRYGPFTAVDAAGRPVPVRLALSPSSLLVSLASAPSLSPFVHASPAFVYLCPPSGPAFVYSCPNSWLAPHSWPAPLTLIARLTAPPRLTSSSGGLFPRSDWIAESDQTGAHAGVAVSSAGDVNGDGYSDVIVGADLYDNGQTDEGRAYLYLGSSAGLSTTAAWTAESDQAGACFGRAVASAGDVDGDGYGDVIVGANLYDNGETDEGRAYVYLGSPAGLSATPAWSAESDQAGAQFGWSVGSAGDVNGDGFSDVIVGARYYDNGETDEGRAYIYLGSPAGLATTPAWTAESDQAGARFAWSVGCAGDVDGDGYSDVIVGAPYHSSGQKIWEGMAYLYLGSSSGLSPAPDWTAESDQPSYFGTAVGSAGDVNGDGYSDVIVGALSYTNGQSQEGRAYVYHGSSAGLAPDPAWMAESNQADAMLGFAVGTAGDVDGDGYDDVIVGAWLYDNGQTDEGRAYVYLGSTAGLSLDPVWTAESDQAGAQAGFAVGSAGDVNGDGYADVIVGAGMYDNGQTDEGRAYVYYGSPAGPSPDPAWSATGDQSGAWFGFAVGTAGDVNGDGYGDVIVGARYYDNGQTDEGRAFVYHGSPRGLSTVPAWTAESDQAGANFGNAAATAGDVNGDGFSDVVVGAYAFDTGQPDVGRAYVYLGSAGGLSTSPAWTAEGDQGYAYFGNAAATAGDVNGDGFSDVIVGASGYDSGTYDWGRAYVYLGSASGLDPTASWIKLGEAAYDQFGFAVGTAGDVNGDGYDDIIIGAFGHDSGTYDWGYAYVYLGSASGLDPTASWIKLGEAANDQFGFAVGTAGDINGDGFGDVIVGAHGHDNGQNNEGRAYVYVGSAAGLSPDPAWTAESNQAESCFGERVGTAGDVNGDGYADVVVAAHAYDYGQADEGAVFVYHGSAQGLSTSPTWTTVGKQYDARAGLGVGTAGDVNGDGYSDIIVGAYSYDDGPTGNAGAAFVYYGSPGGLARGAAWTAESDQGSAELGLSVGSAGDVNGDGYADIIVGAPYYDSGQADEGRAYVYHGSPAGPSPTPSWRAEGDQPQANLGFAVGTAGDVNGDGYADVIVGAPGFDNGQADEGAALVWHGSPTGLGPYGTPGNAQWRVEGEQVNAFLGRAVGTAGDVNGDGYADVIVGAYGFDSGQTDEGRAYAYLGSAAGLLTSPAWSAESDQANARFGWAVGTAGDVDGDGTSDVIVGAPRFDNGETDEGQAYLYRGSATGLQPTPTWSAEGGQAGAYFGFAVATAGDADGDGYADVVVGAPYHDQGPSRPDVGRAYLYRGSPTGTLPAPDWTAEGDQAGAFLGYAVATAGDVDGDGYADVVVGAPYYSNGPVDEGRALVYHGAAGGLSGTAHWTAESNQPSLLLGYAAASAGDVNGDGYADVVVGVPFYGNGVGQEAEGAAYLYYGNGGDALDLTPRQMRTDGSAPIAPLGMSDSPTAVQLRLTGRIPLGREEVKLQWQAAPLSTPFTATTAISGTSAAWTDTLTTGVVLVQDVSGLIPGAPYHWRVRLLYRPGNLLGQPAGRWVHIPWNAWTEEAFRTPGQCSPPGAASFSWLPSLPAAGETITFTGVATGTPPLALTWDWGDGQRASGATVTHTYALSGTYAVLMMVAGPCGSRALVTHTVVVGIPEGGGRVYLPLVYKQ